MTALGYAPTTRFDSPEHLTAAEPPEQRGLSRDGVRLLVVRPDRRQHTTFSTLPQHLERGDLVVVNNSATLAAEVDATLAGGWPAVLHFATPLDDGHWVVELRTAPDGARPVLSAHTGDVLALAHHGGRIRLLEPYPRPNASPTGRGSRLWRAQVMTDRPLQDFLAEHGRPIAYGYLSNRWPLSDYQTVFATEPGSAEMPSAARPFTPELVTHLVSRGIVMAPITLHTGVSSQEASEPPQAERFSVPDATARLVDVTRWSGRRVVAVGTTVTRALESAVGPDGRMHATSGWTDLVIGPDHPVQVVSGLITGLHNPDASHLLLVEAVAGSELTQLAYDEAVANRYLWHEFGDSCLLLP